jgi:hypothetical protein
MDGLSARLHAWWATLSPRERRQASALALIAFGYIVHYAVFCIVQPFFIEDSAITFAYARNFVEGEGFVTWRGGERVEGFSNALWTFLIAGLRALGVPTWTGAKLSGGVLGVVTLPIAFDLVRRLRPGRDDDVALLAPLLLALSPQFVIWNASGLENSLFCVLLAGGIWRLERELAGDARGPWSALLFVALAMTRPESVAYGVFAGIALLIDAVAHRRIKPVLLWTVAFLVPFGAYFAWRYSYFGWEFPNTYYAKQHQGTPFQPFNWGKKGWKYINAYLKQYGVAYTLPLLAFAMTGLRGWRRWVSVGVTLVVGFLVLWDGKAGLGALGDLPDAVRAVQDRWVHIRVFAIAGSLLLLGLVGFGRRAWRLRGLLWLTLCFGGFFALYSGGDWMKAFRWFNLTSVPLFVLLAAGIGELADGVLDPRWRLALDRPGVPASLRRGVGARAALFTLPVLALGGVAIYKTVDFAYGPETATRDIHRRVRYMTWVQRRLDLDEVTLLDVDMGAHMYFTDWAILDIAGLVDVPMARHKDWNKRFMRQYVFEEARPEFAHVHSGWARSSKIPTHREWKQQYLEIPGYPIGGTKLHVGNHVRKDIFVKRAEPLPDGAVRFEGGITLVSVDAPSPVVAPGGLLFLDTRWAARFRDHPFDVLVVLDDGEGNRTVQVMEPGYGWYPADEWKTSEHVEARFRVPIPEHLRLGTYALSFVLIDGDTGEVLPALGLDADLPPPSKVPPRKDRPTADPADDGDAVASAPAAMLPPASGLAVGEWPTDISVKVGSDRDARKEAGLKLALARVHASDGLCEKAWPTFKDATRHILRDLDWREDKEPVLRRELAGCYIARAGTLEDRVDRAEALEQARRWDRHHPDLDAMVQPLADDLEAEARDFVADEQWGAAYLTYARVMRLDPSRSWTRREAEAARDHSLGIAEVEEDTAEEEEEDAD